MGSGGDYVHGYGTRESDRLVDQAGTLVGLLHSDTAYPPGSRVLEAGCGTGAQTVTLARNSPEATIVSVDLSATSLAEAMAKVEDAGLANVRLVQADVFDLCFAPCSFDYVFVCFVLEHLPRPVDALLALGELLAPGGTITVIEGDHGSAHFHPDSDEAQLAIEALITLQRRAGGNALIGREVYPLLASAGFHDVHVSPGMVYVDGSRPDLIEGFTKRTFTAMVEGVRDEAVSLGLVEAEVFDAGVEALTRTAADDGVFCYTFFKGVARRSAAQAGGEGDRTIG